MTSPVDPISQARTLLKRAVPGLSERSQAELAIELAHALLDASHALSTRAERANAERLQALMEDENGQAFATAITDRVHRSQNGAQLVRQVRSLIAELGIPRSLQRLDRLELRALRSLGSSLPELTAAAVRQRIYHDASPYIVPADSEVLGAYLRRMAGQNVRVNVNHLGEEVLGEREAERHLAAYAELLERPEVSTISVKISSLYSQLRPLAWDHSVELLCERLRQIYRRALTGAEPKLVYLDMESYRDLAMTVELFTKVLDEPDFAKLTAGIVLQAYVPDSVGFQQRLTEWAKHRISAGKAPIRVRIVKGANLAMERLEASHRGWPLATYGSKLEVDANYKRLLLFACRPDNARAVRLGVASHNLFDLSFGLVVRKCQGVEEFVELEMLEGMAQSLRRALQTVAGSVLVYAPSVDQKNFPAAVAYLVRRLDENTGEDNFLRHSFGMQAGDSRFTEQAEAFLQAFDSMSTTPSGSYRASGLRSLARAEQAPGFENEPDTDFTNPDNRAFIEAALAHAEHRTFEVHLSIGGEEEGAAEVAHGFDPSRPGHLPYTYPLADAQAIDRALSTAVVAASEWSKTSPKSRVELLLAVANRLRAARAELVAHMLLDAGKRVEEGDAEVSEAVDFAEYYARQFLRLSEVFETSAKGVVVVTPPWNFPLAIPFGGVAAALVAGNAVILKPAPESVLVASTLVRLCYDAGVPKRVLQFVCAEDEVGSHLIQDRRVNTVVLTGATSTAHLFHRLRPGLDLIAETGGKNAIYVSDVSDHEQACRHAVHSAFGHAGQKCSACSLLIVHRELFHDENFKAQLVDASQSLRVGSAWHLDSFVTPLIHPPSGPLLRAIEQLEKREEWALQPRVDPENPRLVSPGIKWNVLPGSFCHTTELFGPVLSVMSVSNVEQALQLVRQTPYGLTTGVQSLDPDECADYAERVDAGNVYINHPITGAIVGRQPFGGRNASGFGPGAKAGGPNYVAQFCRIGARRQRIQAPSLSRGPRRDVDASVSWVAPSQALIDQVCSIAEALSEAERDTFRTRLHNYRKVQELEFSRMHPQDDIEGVHNLFRYQPSRVLLLLTPKCTLLDALSSLLAARLCGAELTVLMSPELTLRPIFRELKSSAQVVETFASIGRHVSKYRIQRLRCPGELPNELWKLPSKHAVSITAGPADGDGYIELRRYLNEQSVCVSYHRYGNLSQPQVPGLPPRPRKSEVG